MSITTNFGTTLSTTFSGSISNNFTNIVFPTSTTNLTNQYGLSIVAVGGVLGAINNSILLSNNNTNSNAGSAIDFSNYNQSVPSGRITGFDDNVGSTILSFSNFQSSGAQTLIERLRIDGFGKTTITGTLNLLGGASSNFIDVDSTGISTRARALALRYTPQNSSWTPNTDPQDGSRGLGLYTNANTRPVVLTLRNLAQPTTQLWDIINEGGGNTRLFFQSYNNGSINSPLTLDGTLQRVGINNISPAYSFHTFGSRIEIENPSGEARFGCYNGGGVTEWAWGQPSAGDSNFVFNKKISSTETNVFYINGGGSVPNIIYQVPLTIAPSVNPNIFPLQVSGNPLTYFTGQGLHAPSDPGYHVLGGSNTISNGGTVNYTGTFSAYFENRVIALEVWTPSDIRLKENIVNLDLENCYNFVQSIQPKSFTWKGEEKPRTNYGYIAQDALKKGFKDLITAVPSEGLEAYEDDEIRCDSDVKFIFNYQDVIPILHKVIIDLKEKQESQEASIKVLQEQIKSLTQ